MRFAYHALFFFGGRPILRTLSLGSLPIFRALPSFDRQAFRSLSCLCISAILILTACRRPIDPKIAAIRTENIRASLKRATHYIDSARNLLVAKDPDGDSIHVAAALLHHTPLGDSVLSAVRTLITVCHDSWPTPATIINIDNAFHFTKQMVAPGAWDQVYFTDTPTATAYTLLSSMEDECKSAVNFAISSIGDQER